MTHRPEPERSSQCLQAEELQDAGHIHQALADKRSDEILNVPVIMSTQLLNGLAALSRGKQRGGRKQQGDAKMSDGPPGSSMDSVLDSLGGGFTSLILGALVLWVGQTTFKHNGTISGFQHQMEAVHARHDALRTRYDELVKSLNERTQSRFTAADGEKISNRVIQLENSTVVVKEDFNEKLNSLKMKIAGVEMKADLQAKPSSTVPAPRISSYGTKVMVSNLEREIERLDRIVQDNRGQIDRYLLDRSVAKPRRSVHAGHSEQYGFRAGEGAVSRTAGRTSSNPRWNMATTGR
jgi:hypothetical protein